jgi:DNA-binding MarR family transcriptional regulator/ribosomal protein S18 acetylase RimI-like enzyme
MDHFGVMAFGSRLKRLSDYLFTEVESIYKQHEIGFSPTHFPILRQLQQVPALTVVELSAKLGLSHPAISKQINKLVKDEWVSKRIDEDDNRRLFIVLTEKGQKEMEKVEPILNAIKLVMEREANNIDARLLYSFNAYEKHLLKYGLQTWVEEEVYKNVEDVEITSWCPALKAPFKTLNMEWLNAYFEHQIEKEDLIILDNPQSEVLAKGGYIWGAKINQECVGICALMPDTQHSFKVIKLAVDERFQQQGIGLSLMLKCIAKARSKGAQYLSLETASKLEPAMKLYQRLGFEIKTPVNGYSVDRSDVYMELAFPKG